MSYRITSFNITQQGLFSDTTVEIIIFNNKK